MWKAKIILLMVIAWSVSAFGNSLEADTILQASPCANPLSMQQQTTGFDIGLTAAIQEFLAPPSVASHVPGKLAAEVKYLPTVPAAFFMVLWGFICVIIIRDHKLMLVALAAFCWAGQTGVNAIPKLISRLAQKHQENLSPELSSHDYLGNLFGYVSFNKDFQYIGLLRSLNGIPDDNAVKSLFANSFNRQASRLVNLHADAILTSQISNSLLNTYIRDIERIFYFSPAFIFNNLARGPPVSTIKLLFLN